jgi:alpha-galactosidase
MTEPVPNKVFSWNRAHFGAWCIISAPLILGLPLSDASLAPVLNFIGNAEAIAINQAWAGHPGLLVEEVQVGKDAHVGFIPQRSGGVQSHASVIQPSGGSLAAASSAPSTLATSNVPEAAQVHHTPDVVPSPWDQTNLPDTALPHNGIHHASEVALGTNSYPSQLWAKPQPAGAAAALLINTSPQPLHYSLLLAKLNLTAASYTVRNVWAREAHPASPVNKDIEIVVAPYDSSFLLLSPVQQRVV